MKVEGIGVLGKFYDDTNFPKGFNKSGEFTIDEADILHQYGKTLRALENGKRTPQSDQEALFLECCRGKREPTTAVEQAWSKYHHVIGNRVAVSAFGSTPTIDKPSSIAEIGDDIDEGIDIGDDIDDGDIVDAEL